MPTDAYGCLWLVALPKAGVPRGCRERLSRRTVLLTQPDALSNRGNACRIWRAPSRLALMQLYESGCSFGTAPTAWPRGHVPKRQARLPLSATARCPSSAPRLPLARGLSPSGNAQQRAPPKRDAHPRSLKPNRDNRLIIRQYRAVCKPASTRSRRPLPLVEPCGWVKNSCLVGYPKHPFLINSG